MGTADYHDAVEQVKLYSDAASVPTVETEAVERFVSKMMVADSEGTPPGEPGYIPTYSVEMAVAEVYDLKATRALAPQTTGFTSEGSSVTRSAIDPAAFTALAQRWRNKALGGGGFTVIDLRAEDSRPAPRSTFTGETSDNPVWWRDVD